MKRQRRKFNQEAMDRILMYYAEICIFRGYHPRFIGRRIREFEDAFDGREN
jgi:hypothetical protein